MKTKRDLWTHPSKSLSKGFRLLIQNPISQPRRVMTKVMMVTEIHVMRELKEMMTGTMTTLVMVAKV